MQCVTSKLTFVSGYLYIYIYIYIYIYTGCGKLTSFFIWVCSYIYIKNAAR
jgi:hypothetical protein